MFELLLGHLDDPVKNVGFELLDLPLEEGLNHFVDFSERLPQLGVEVVLDAVVASE